MKNNIGVLVCLITIIFYASFSCASHVREECKCNTMDQGELKYSVMLNLPQSQNNTNDSSGVLLTVMLGQMVADLQLQKTQSDNLAESLVDHIEVLISYELTTEKLINRIETGILAKISPEFASTLLTKARNFARKAQKPDVYKVLNELHARLIKKKFAINVGLEDAIENLDEQKFRHFLEAAGCSEAVIKQALKYLFSGCHESVSFYDYDAKGNVLSKL